MSDQIENKNEPSRTVTPQEMREYLLAEIEASKQVLTELSDEQLEEVAGAARVEPLTGWRKALLTGTAATSAVAFPALIGYAIYRDVKHKN